MAKKTLTKPIDLTMARPIALPMLVLSPLCVNEPEWLQRDWEDRGHDSKVGLDGPPGGCQRALSVPGLLNWTLGVALSFHPSLSVVCEGAVPLSAVHLSTFPFGGAVLEFVVQRCPACAESTCDRFKGQETQPEA